MATWCNMHTHCILQNYNYAVSFYVFLQQVWCVDNCVTISHFYVTFKPMKCDEILLKNWNWNTTGTEKYEKKWNCN